jgi:hypothetical protein
MESVQDLINTVLWDRRLVLLPDGRVLVILNPTVANRNIAILEKRLVMQEALAAETPTEEQLMADFREGGSWTEEDDLVLKEGEKHIAFLEAEKSRQKFLTKKRRIEEQIDETREKLSAVLQKKQHIYVMTAEYMAQEAFIFSLLQQTVMNRDGTLFFRNDNSITHLKDSDRELLNILVKEVTSEGGLPNSDIRKVARSMEWRMLWTLNREDIAGLFNVPVSNLSLNQRMLIYWSRVYDLAYESTVKPDDDVIQDDDKFDTWLQNRSNEKVDSDSAKRRGAPDHHERGVVLDGYYVETCTCGVGTIKIRGHGERPRHASDCSYGVYKKYTREEKDKIADEIYGRNSAKIRQIQTHEQEMATKGAIDEKDLLNRKARMILGSKQEVHRINK